MNIASLNKRIIAYLLDIVLIYILISLIISIRIINPNYENYIEVYEKYNNVLEKYTEKEITTTEMVNLNKDNLYYLTKYSLSSNLVVILVIIGYFVFFQKYNHGQTIGKKIMKIKVVTKDLREVSLSKYLLRLIPMYYLFIGNVLAVILNTITVLIFDSDSFIYINSGITYTFIGIGIISLVMMIKSQNKEGLQDKISKTVVLEV